MDDKVIVTHRGALTAKYGANGVSKIRKALNALVAADKKRGIRTRVVHLDDAAEMKQLRVKPMTVADDCPDAKRAIDGVFKALKPDYLMILGGPDVIPHQDVKNPARDAGDGDAEAWSDLPYACDVPYSREAASFVGPTRVVGRLPDLTGARVPTHLLALLKTAASWKRQPKQKYLPYFGLSTFTWQRATLRSLEDIFGNNDGLLISPPKGPRHPARALAAPMHFINCHGGKGSSEFSGQKGADYPISLTTHHTRRAIRRGTVASVECCYGAELYDSVMLGIDEPICQSYLRQGSYGYLGSTTIAYGPAKPPNGAADVICARFLTNVLCGASIGRAALMARQQFVEQCDQADPIDLKTLAQFCLFGDPSIHPVSPEDEAAPAPTGVTEETASRLRRTQRRAKLQEKGQYLKRTKPTASKREKGARMTSQAKRALGNFAVEGGLPRTQPYAAFSVTRGHDGRPAGAKLARIVTRYYVTVGRPRSAARDGYRVVVVAKERNGKVFDHRIYYER